MFKISYEKCISNTKKSNYYFQMFYIDMLLNNGYP